VAGILLSIVLDMLWLFLGASSQDSSAQKRFGSVAAAISFLTRLLMALVYWKDSLDFDNIMLAKKVDKALRTVSNQV